MEIGLTLNPYRESGATSFSINILLSPFVSCTTQTSHHFQSAAFSLGETRNVIDRLPASSVSHHVTSDHVIDHVIDRRKITDRTVIMRQVHRTNASLEKGDEKHTFKNKSWVTVNVSYH